MAWLGFGIMVPVVHPGVFVATLGATVLAMSGTAVVMAAVFVVSRSARNFQNALSYPLFLLGGVMVPAALLPEWLQPLSQAVFLSWSTDLLRDTLAAEPVPAVGARLTVVLLLGALGFVVGSLLLRWLVVRVRREGTVNYA